MCCSSSYSYSACGNKENHGNLMNKSVSSPFSWVSIYFLFLAKLNRKGKIFDGARREAALWDYSQEHLVVIKYEKVCPFVKFEIILPLICCLLDPLTNKHCSAWSSMINLWIDSRTCQKYITLLSAKQKSNNYLELSKENVLGECCHMILSHWPCFSWKVFIISFHKIPNFTFQKWTSCPRNICTEYWRKPPIFLYLKNKDSIQHV